MADVTSKYTRAVIACFKVLLWLYIPAMLYKGWKFINADVLDFPGSWCYSEMLINYQGGLTRRGLIGEMVYQLSSATGVLPHFFFMPLCVVCAVFFIGFVIVQMRRRGLRWWLAATPLMFGGAYECLVRKDFIVLCLFVASLYLCRSKIPATLRLIAVTLICILSLMVYEPSFFIFMPLLALVIWKSVPAPKAAKIAAFAVVILCMGWQLTLIGSEAKALAIHNSWQSLFPAFIGGNAGFSIKAIAWNIHDSLAYNHSVLLDPLSPTMLCLVVTLPLAYFVYTRYIYTFGNTPTSGKQLPTARAWRLLIVFQMLSLTPMWLGLSCDFGRMLMYVITTSLCVMFILPEDTVDRLFPGFIYRKASSTPAPTSAALLCTLMAIAPVSFAFFKIAASLSATMVWQAFDFLWQIKNMLI